MNKTKRKYPIKVLDKAFDTLDILIKQNSWINITKISKELNLYPSTTHRILDTLKHWNYVEQDPQTQKYRLGLKALEIGIAKNRQIDLVKDSDPYLKELSNMSEETVHLGILDNNEVFYLAKEESSQIIRMCSEVGKRAPIYCTALGKILVAYLTKEERMKVLEQIELVKYTKNTITDKKELEKVLENVRKQGFAQDKEENEIGDGPGVFRHNFVGPLVGDALPDSLHYGT